MNKKLSKIITGTLFSLSLVGLVNNGVYAMDKSEVNWSNFNDLTTDEMMDFFNYSQDKKEEKKAQYTDEELREYLYDVYTMLYTREYKDDSVPEPPKDGDDTRLMIGFTGCREGVYYCKDEQRIKVNGWQQINGYWYHFTNYLLDEGWYNDNGVWYYLNSKRTLNEGCGQMQTGWIKDDNTWYYLKDNGAMMSNGWLEINGTWYYFYSSGAMAANTTIDGYYLNSSGAWIK